MSQMIDKVAESILDAYANHPFERHGNRTHTYVTKDGEKVFEGTELECKDYQEEQIAKLYAHAAITELVEWLNSMWVEPKDYAAKIKEGLNG